MSDGHGGNAKQVSLHFATADIAQKEALGIIRAFHDHLPEGLLFVEADGFTLRFINSTALNTLRLPFEAMADVPEGRTDWTIPVYREDAETPLPDNEWPVYRAIRNDEVLRGIVLAIRKGQEEPSYILCNASPVRNAKGEITGGTMSWHTIDALKKTQTKLEEQQRELERARTRAERANDSKSELLAHISHELRTPLSGIIGILDILSSRIHGTTDSAYLSSAKESARSLLAIIGDLLDLSRIEAGQMELDPSDCETRELIETVVAPFRITAERKGLDLSLEIADDIPPYIRLDKEKTAQVLRNLISNAVKYTERGGVRVTADREKTGGDRTARLRFRVSDTGIGIPEEKQEAIFKSFTRLHGSGAAREIEGTGLGLTISKQLARIMGGAIQVESTAGAGSTFTFTVDAAVLERMASRQAGSPASELEALPPLRILLAEDNRINQMFISAMLTTAGHTVTVARDGREALGVIEGAREEGFDLVLMDVQMPRMDGLEATKRIRRLSSFASEVPIIALTAFAMQGDEQRFRSAGMNGYVTKPIDWAELARVIREL